MSADVHIGVRFFRLSDALRPYFTALYHFDLDAPPGALIEDYLHPEWSVLRFIDGDVPLATMGGGRLEEQWPFVVSGPTSKSIHFALRRSRIWGLGLLPTGWARFVGGQASDYADRTLDGTTDPAFSLFRGLAEITRAPRQSPEAIAQHINAYLLMHLGKPQRHEAQVAALHEALRDADLATVPDLAQRVGIGTRSLERLAARFFGFSPKQLLRRQRFLRSLAQFMLGSGNWIEAMDGQYYDQAQFVKDFRSFMSMTPSEYADMPHPVLSRIMAQRMADLGAAPETDLPTVLRYGAQGADQRTPVA